ncbi:hypothetical protein GCM10022289_15140 [Pedobacter jeongneungensis]|uniref:Uncharacterized protein n=1 Tax=Pedobacter jeongneungensis TaxID=947309 RepID=A0ABP8B9M8_9SPHI
MLKHLKNTLENGLVEERTITILNTLKDRGKNGKKNRQTDLLWRTVQCTIRIEESRLIATRPDNLDEVLEDYGAYI